MPFGVLSRIDWECSSPDINLITWQAAVQDSGGFAARMVGQEPPALSDSHELIDSIRAEPIGDTAIVRDCGEAAYSLGAPRNFEPIPAAQ